MGAAQGLDFAVGVGKVGLQQQLARALQSAHIGQEHLALALGIQGCGQLVGQQALGRRILRCTLRTAGRAKAVTRPARKRHPLLPQQGIDLHLLAFGRAAIEVMQAHRHRHCPRLHQRRFGHGLHTALQHRQAKLLHTKLPRVQRKPPGGIAIDQLNPVRAQLGSRGHGKAVHRITGRAILFHPFDRNFIALPAAHMGDGHRRRRHIGQSTQALHALRSDKVLHRHRLARPHQAAIEHRVGHDFGVIAPALGQIEPPRLNPALPVAPDKGHVALGPGTDKPVAAFCFAIALRCLADNVRQQQQPITIGQPLGLEMPGAGRNLHLRPGNRPPPIQTGNPDGRIFFAQLGMHGQIRHQRRGAHKHPPLGPQSLIEQGCAQVGRINL